MIYICPQCLRTWFEKPLFRSHAFPPDYKIPANGAATTIFLRCPGRPKEAVRL